MPKRQSHRRRKLGGGWFDGTSSTNTYSTSTYPTQSSTGSSWWNSLMGTSTMNTIPTGTSTMNTGMGTSTMNTYDSNYDSMRGKRIMGNQIVTDPRFTQRSFGGRTRGRKMKGGFHDNTSTTDLAANAAPFSGPTAEPHNLVGGRTRRRGRKTCKKCGKKSCKKCGKTYRNRK